MKIIQIIDTPNPDSKKFLLDAVLLNSGVRQYDGIDMAKNDPFAGALFAVDGVMAVFYMKNFVTVTKYPELGWKKLTALVGKAIETAPVPPAPAASTTEKVDDGGSAALLLKINEAINQNIRPALANDGGGLEVIGLEEKTLTIRYQGACGGCPSATMGTLMAIQSLLQQTVDPELRVAAVP